MLRIEGLTKRYRTGDLALNGVDLEVPAGEVIGADRSVGRRQIDADPLRQPAGRADRRPGFSR